MNHLLHLVRLSKWIFLPDVHAVSTCESKMRSKLFSTKKRLLRTSFRNEYVSYLKSVNRSWAEKSPLGVKILLCRPEWFTESFSHIFLWIKALINANSKEPSLVSKQHGVKLKPKVSATNVSQTGFAVCDGARLWSKMTLCFWYFLWFFKRQRIKSFNFLGGS